MLDWQKRVVVEKEELDKKIAKLESFDLTTVSVGESVLLREQLVVMQDYSSILKNRIAGFKVS